ncbi:MAG TPA: MCP four helix bundle domain-containing protein, partial [Candidatus Omnitrophota bacterium]|nr:MCP four helix bundle domain-containing protein [Candidatus Omnitrophota bacterium]
MEIRFPKRPLAALFFLFTALAAWFAVDRVDQLAQAVSSLRDQPFAVSESLLRAHDEAFAEHAALHDAIIAPTPEARDRAVEATAAHEAALRAELMVITERYADAPRLLGPLFESLSEFRQLREQVADLLAEERNSEAHAVMASEGEAIYRRQHEAMSAILEAERRHAAELRQQAEAATETAHGASLLL